MKCVELVGPKKLEVKSRVAPTSKDGSVVFRVNICGICGSDIHYWDMGAPVGLVMGHEFCGTVIDPGARSDLKVGDRITGLPISPCGKCDACKHGNPQYCKETWSHAVGLSLDYSGGYAEVSSCHPDMVRKLPDIISNEEACMVEPSAVSLHAVNLANVKVGDKVCVIGGGIIGLMAAEFAKMNGASYVCMVEANRNRGKKSLTYGYVDEYFNALNKDTIPNLVAMTNGFDVVIEACGNSAAVSEAMMLVKNGGMIVLVGVSMAPISVPMIMPVMGEVSMKGAIGYKEEEFDDVIELLRLRKLDVVKYIDDIIPIDAANSAFERLTNMDNDAIKIIFKPNN